MASTASVVMSPVDTTTLPSRKLRAIAPPPAHDAPIITLYNRRWLNAAQVLEQDPPCGLPVYGRTATNSATTFTPIRDTVRGAMARAHIPCAGFVCHPQRQ